LESTCKPEECATPNVEDPSDIVYITAPFPAINIVDGGVQFITMNVSSGPEIPDPLPEGVAPADYLNARDKKNFTACVAAWYRVYVTMVTGCLGDYSSGTSIRACMDKSFRAYVNNIKEDCYANYYY
jgi:hypothetical protein